MNFHLKHPYEINPKYKKRVAYLCMEYAIHQPLKLYAGGLGYLAGSHLRSAYQLKQNLVAVGILWKYGYYDQVRKADQTMEVLYQEKVYGFLQSTGIKFKITVSHHDVWVTAYLLPPDTFQCAPLFLLSTDLPENDYLAKTICHRLYDSNPETKIAASILLGVGGCKLFDYLDWKPELFHLNESHALPAAFYLLNLHRNIDTVRSKVVFTNHTPEEGGNPRTNIWQLEKMGFFCNVPVSDVRTLVGFEGDMLNHTLAALKLSRIANGVSKLHERTLAAMWKQYKDKAPIISITNAQNYVYWANIEMYDAVQEGRVKDLQQLKLKGKDQLFELVADQNGEIFDRNIFTIVFAKRFTGYKRADLLLRDIDRFNRMINNKQYPVQIVWAGKPYPADYTAIGIFDKIVNMCKQHPNCAALVGYELLQSKVLKNGSDAWLNTPRLGHEASGTSGMSAAMNGAVNVSIPDGWIPEFAKDKVNSFIIAPADARLTEYEQDDADAATLYDLLENEVIPMYYNDPARWLSIMSHSLQDVVPFFDSNRMADEYYSCLYEHLSQYEDKPVPDKKQFLI